MQRLRGDHALLGLLALAVLALLLALGLLLLRSSEADIAVQGAPAAQPTSPKTAPPPPAPPADGAEPGRRAAAAPGTELPGTTGDAGRRLLPVRVLDPQGAPVPEAVVQWIPIRDIREDWPRMGKHLEGVGHDLRTLFDELGERTVADEQGVARIPVTPDVLVMRLAGTAPGLFHEEVEGGIPGKVEILLRLRPAKLLRVRVVDAGGRPVAGVRVAVFPSSPNRFLEPARAARRAPRADTDEEGRVIFRDLPARLEGLPSGSRAGLLTVRVPGPFAPPVEERVDPAAPDGTRVRLRLAGTERREPETWSHLGARETRGGRARFPAVGLGLSLEALAVFPDHPREIPGAGAGPRRPGEEVRFELRPEAAAMRIVGLALTADRRPVAGQRLWLDWHSRWDDLPWFAETDAGGRFSIPLVAQPDEGTTVRFELHLEEDGQVLASAPVVLPSPLAPGDNDVGEILLQAQAWAMGRVLDAGRGPIGGATVVLEEPVADPRGSILDEDAWRPVAGVSATTSDLQGRFELRATGGAMPADGDWRLTATAPGLVAAHRFLSGPDQSVTLRLPRTRLVGTLLADREVAGFAIAALFLPEEDAGAGPSRPTRTWTARWDLGAFWWEDLAPGLGRVELRVSETGELLAAVDGVEVLDNTETRDPRLNPVDLRGRLRRLNLRFLDTHGVPVPRVTILPADPTFPSMHQGIAGVWRPLLAGEALPDFLVLAEGFLATRLHGVREDRDVVLERAPLLEFRLEPVPELPADFYVHLELQPVALPDTGYGASGGEFDDRGNLALRAPARGRVRLRAGVEKTDEEGARTAFARGLLEPAELLVPATGERFSFVLRLDPVLLEQKLQEFR